MSISQIIKKYHKNRIENIRKMSNGIDKNMAIGSFVADLGKGSIKPVANAIGSCFRKVKKCYLLFTSNSMQMSLEFRGRQSIIKKYPKLKNDIEQKETKKSNLKENKAKFENELKEKEEELAKLTTKLTSKELEMEEIKNFAAFVKNRRK